MGYVVRWGGHGERQQDGTRRPTTGARTTRTATIIFSLSFLRVRGINTVPGSTYWYLLFIGTSLVFVVKAKLYTLHGKRPPENDQGRGMTAVLHLAKTVRENVAIIDIRKGDFGCIALFSLHARQS